MTFKGFSLKVSLLVTVGFFALMAVVSAFVGQVIGMVLTAGGMILAGMIGLKNDSYAIVLKNDMYKRSKNRSHLILYLNYLLIFLGIVMIYQQIF